MLGNKGISIWFFIGTILLIYGIIITAANIAEKISPTLERQVVLKELNFGIWWGVLLIAVGLTYFIGFRPWKKKT